MIDFDSIKYNQCYNCVHHYPKAKTKNCPINEQIIKKHNPVGMLSLDTYIRNGVCINYKRKGY